LRSATLSLPCAHRPGLMLRDVDMPWMDGEVVAAACMAQNAGKPIPARLAEP
jgi:hypothetical protein